MRTRAHDEPDEEDDYGDDAGDDLGTDIDDPEAPDASDTREGDEPAFVKCPACGKMIVEDAERCPRCGHYVQDAELSRRPTWIVAVVIATLVAAALTIYYY